MNRSAGTSYPLTHEDRVVDRKSKTTKRAIAEYYALVAKRILPNIVGRPLPIVRCPDGLAGECFFQKHWMSGLPRSVEQISIAEKSKTSDYMVVHDLGGLLALVQMGMIELHPWGSRVEDLERPDRLVFDLDPGEGVSWSRLCDAAKNIRTELKSLGLSGFAKLTGGKGIHVVVPIEPDLVWDECRKLCRDIAIRVTKKDPKNLVATMSKEMRRGKVFIDYLRNTRGATAVAPFSLRAKSGLPIAMPVGWGQLSGLGGSQAFQISEVAEHLKSQTRDPWRGFSRLRQRLSK